MGLGLFNTKLYPNLKCLLFSFVLIAIYYLPHPRAFAHQLVMIALFTLGGYIMLAWYDVIYDCNDKLRATYFGWISIPFKPKYYGEQYKQLPLKQQKIIRNIDIAALGVLVLLFVYPFLVSRRR